MKSLIIVLALYSGANALCAQSIPAAVTAAFNQKFSAQRAVHWEKEGDGSYEAEWKQNKQEFSATFSAQGQWLETESSIALDALPAAVREAFAKTYAGATLQEAARIENTAQETFFEVEFRHKGKRHEAFYTADGVIRK